MQPDSRINCIAIVFLNVKIIFEYRFHVHNDNLDSFHTEILPKSCTNFMKYSRAVVLNLLY